MTTSIVEYVEQIGVDAISFQLLSSAISNITQTKRDGSKVTFCTEAISPADVLNNTGRVGMILWIEREAFDRVNKAISTERE
jgi:hypothetical protein